MVDMFAQLLPPALDLGTLVLLLIVARQLFGAGKVSSSGVDTFLQDLLEAQRGIQALEKRVNEAPQKAEPSVDAHRVATLEARQEQLELRFTTLVEEVEERSRYAKGVWKKIAAAQRRLEDGDSEEEGGVEFQTGDGETSDPSQLSLMSEAMGGDEEVRRLARQAVAFGR